VSMHLITRLFAADLFGSRKKNVISYT